MRNPPFLNLHHRSDSSSGVVGSNHSSPVKKRRTSSCTSDSRFVGCGRFTFILCLCGAAAALGYLAYYFTSTAEDDLAQSQFDSISERALTEAVNIFQRKRHAVTTLANMVGQLHPNASDWPFVAIPAFEQLVKNLLLASAGDDIGFIPFVQVDELPLWEKFAYNFYYNEHNPPYPNTTAVSPFGRGVWAVKPNASLTDVDQRYHDTTAETTYGSPYKILTPVFHVDEGVNRVLLFNHHSTAVRGKQIDSIIDCVQQQSTEGDTDDRKPVECEAVTDMVSIIKYEARGTAAIIYKPIFPLWNPDTLTGVIPAAIVFDTLLDNAFSRSVNGIDCVVSCTSCQSSSTTPPRHPASIREIDR